MKLFYYTSFHFQGMQTRERAHCARSVFPFIKKKKKRRRGLRFRPKEKAPLRGANWPHRKSQPGANQITSAADLGPPAIPSNPHSPLEPGYPSPAL